MRFPLVSMKGQGLICMRKEIKNFSGWYTETKQFKSGIKNLGLFPITPNQELP